MGAGGGVRAGPLPSPAMTPTPTDPAGAPAPPARTQQRLWRLAVVGALLPVLLVLALGAYALQTSRTQYEKRTELLTQNLAAAIDRSVSANIEKVDLALSSIVDHLERQLAAGPLDLVAASAHIRSQAARRAELEGIRVTDALGVGILGPGLDGSRSISFAERQWFQVQRDRADAGLFMSQPLVSKLGATWIVSFSRRFRTPQGGFAGVVSAAVPLSYFQRQLRELDVGAHGAVILRDTNLGMITRYPPAQDAAANEPGNTKVSPELRRGIESGAAQGSFHALVTADGIERVGSFRRLGVAPLVVIVGLAAQDYLDDWYGEVRTVAAFCGVMLLLYAGGGALLWRLLAQNRQARARIELLAQVFEHSGEAIVLTDRDNRIVEVNPAFERQTGYAAAELVGRAPGLLDAHPALGQIGTEAWDTLRRTGQWRGEIVDRGKDGREYPKWLSVSVVRDGQGAVTHYIGSSIDMTELKQAEARIRHLAHHDTLTQLPNRVHLHGRLEQAMASARRQGGQLAMLFIDMDRFKNINDTLGHHIGDGLLVEVGQRLRGLVRDSDIVARLGGDEFVIVLGEVGGDGVRAAAAVAAKVGAELGRPYQVRGHELHSTPSIGIALFPANGEDADTLMKNADAAMYHAKAAGRNNFQFFTAAMNEATTERLALELGLRTAIERGELFLHYQPQVDVPTGMVVGLEALLRWRHPELGLIPPLKFIPIAEETGQIEAIGAWVLEQALQQLAEWRHGSHAALRVAVNLSAQQLRGEGIVTAVAQALQRHGLPGQALELEITESIAMRDPAHTALLLRQLRGHGVALAIDDFGTGYSSLAYLKQLPLSCLKLDRSFVMDIERDANDAAICTASIQLAHALGLGVVAEGVETAAQLDFLRQLGCDTVQGYFLSRPLAAADCARYLAQAEEAAAA